MSEMFCNCGKLFSLDLSSFDTRNVKEMKEIFELDANLQRVTLGDKSSIELQNASCAIGKIIRIVVSR